MSDTATIEPPVTTPPEVKPDSILASIKKAEADRLATAPNSRSIAEKKAAEKAAPVQPAKVEEKKVDAQVDTPVVTEPPKQTEQEKNFAAIRQAREAAEKERDALRAEKEALAKEIETYKVRPDPTEVEKERESYKEKLKTYEAELKISALHRDPEFQAKYDSQIQRRQSQMISILRANGVEEQEAKVAVGTWNKGKFEEYVSTLPVLQQGEFASLVRGAEDLSLERSEAIQNAEKTYEERQKIKAQQGEEQQKAFKNNMRKEAMTVIEEMTGLDGIKGTELESIVKTAVLRAAPIEEGHMNAQEVFRHVASSVLMSKIAESQQEEIKTSREKIAALEKQLKDQEEFIKGKYGSVPKPGDGTVIPANGKEPSLLTSLMKSYQAKNDLTRK